jgi:hypothetical protein
MILKARVGQRAFHISGTWDERAPAAFLSFIYCPTIEQLTDI